MQQRVAVIGAGAAGLCAARHLSRDLTLFHPVVFEQSDCVGGTWVYTENTETDQYDLPVHSSMYSSLKTNLPKEIMAFPDFPFDKNLPSFIGHQDVLKYLINYSEAYELNKFIKFHTRVESVQLLVENGKIRWNVQFCNVKEKHVPHEKQVFDAVMVCNGHYAIPKIPNIPGLASFTGIISHSHTYRHAEDFQGKKLVVLGAGASGIDIALDLAKFAESITISHWKKTLKSTLPENMKQRASIQEVVKNEVVFSDGSREVVDGIIFCTGYNYDFSFLHPDCKLAVNDNRITPLYKHILHTHHPSLSFIGICSTICPFPLFSCQVRFVIASLTGSMQLPSKEQMELDIEKDYQKRLAEGLPNRHAHAMGPRQWQYNDDLCHLAHIQTVPDVVRKLYDAVHDERTWNVANYKKNNYKLIDDNTFDKLETAVH
ncbi:flavin-containing monooxygenase FMO GS-OX-like 4 isoform X2 [Anneissia japonica]|uniref:flavin-containing monooxygenase FMO GS-OX-like 4 isoform X2 n=1 Tax=Anneissia japonica TaxID=1529436 RepID=UPI00142557F2|nr:flavin-containing monooxygenase FMO GS-OX-like 4 isoform X2 [Anneissia japonica]